MRWILKSSVSTDKVKSLSKALQVDTAIATLLVQRGVETFDQAKAFFRPKLSNLHDPFLMSGMLKAVNRIKKAIENKESILIYGDYDVDGTTAVALMASFLKTKAAKIDTYIPDRYKEGYGISYSGIDYAYTKKHSLIIALDCGIKAVDKVEYAKNKGIDFIICDHHTPGDKLPNAVAVLDPKRKDCNYPFKELCGCGVGFKLIQAITQSEGINNIDLIPYLDLVAVAIGADIVPVVDENRLLAYFGMQVINDCPRPGIKALLAQFKKRTFSITDVVFKVAPRINAAGRMKHGAYAVQLLMETEEKIAEEQAKEIEQYNLNRRNVDQQITKEALQQILENNELDHATSVVYHPEWHKGVIGIVASRLIETHYRPTLVFTKSEGVLAASARSVKGFDIYAALEACSKHIEQFGGHKYAAGLTLKPEKYTAFKSAFETYVKNHLSTSLKTPEIAVDLCISLGSITPKFYRILKQFGPFGPQNMSPVFLTEYLQDSGYGKRVGEDEKHLRLNLSDSSGSTLASIGFGLGNKWPIVEQKKTFKAVYTIDENEWNNTVSLQLKLKDVQCQ